MAGSPEAPRPGVPRMLGVGTLGLVGGALLALFVQDLLAAAFVRAENVHAALAVVFVSLIPVVAIVSAVAAVVIDRRLVARGTEKNSHDD